MVDIVTLSFVNLAWLSIVLLTVDFYTSCNNTNIQDRSRNKYVEVLPTTLVSVNSVSTTHLKLTYMREKECDIRGGNQSKLSCISLYKLARSVDFISQGKSVKLSHRKNIFNRANF